MDTGGFAEILFDFITPLERRERKKITILDGLVLQQLRHVAQELKKGNTEVPQNSGPVWRSCGQIYLAIPGHFVLKNTAR